MKHLIVLFFAVVILKVLPAQTPQPIYGFAVESRPLDWYKEQAILWKNEVDKNPKDGNAWANYYRVTRNLASCDTTSKLTRTERFKKLRLLVEEMEKAIPDSYEYNYCKFSLEGNNFNFLKYLKRADELSMGRVLHIDYMINWGEVDRNIERRDENCKKLYEAGQFSTGFLYYNYNVLIGLKPNAILFTAGDNDTYPLWILQSQGIRRDVTVINLYLLRIDEYRTKVFKELKIEKWDLPMDTDGNYKVEDVKKFEEGIVKHVASNKKGYPVYIGLTASGSPIEKIEENLYLVGLVYQYSTESIDNMAIMKRNFEQLYALDYINKPFYKDRSASIVNHANTNYLIPMLKLYDHYDASGEIQKAEWIKNLLLFISKDKPEEKDIKDHFKN